VDSLKYASAAGVIVEVLIDDDIEIAVGRGSKMRRRA
jgi:hypothetical protein